MGAANHHLIFDLLDDIQGAMIEIGCAAWGGSTDCFAAVARLDPRFTFHAVDVNPKAFGHAQAVSARVPRMSAHQMTGEAFLAEEFPKTGQKICFAYLDNYDWNYDEGKEHEQPWVTEQRQAYESMGLEYSNAASARAHLEQTKLITDLAADRCVILFDDTFHDSRQLLGKGMTAVPYLQEQGWKIIEKTNLSMALANY